jgi:hypothetical protein
MDPVYWLRQPVGPPEAPRRWSYSALTAWRTCPRRWWLLHARYDNAPDGKYPPLFGVSAVQGRVVHAALEEWRKSLCRGVNAPRFDARRFIKQAFREILNGDVGRNPRINRGRLEAGFSLDDCVRQVFALAEGLGAPPPAWIRPEATAGADGPPSDAEELWVEVESPPLCGRIDQVRSRTLIDFKTGEADPEGHGEQLLFYVALWWLRYGTLPAGMEIRYPDGAFPLPTPTVAEVAVGVESLRRELATIDAALAAPPPPATPAVETCRFCPVRQLCGDYWSTDATRPIRGLPADKAGAAEAIPPFRDIRLTALPGHWEPGRGLTGTVGLEGGGAVEVTVPAGQCPPTGANRPVGLTILNALPTKGDDGWRARLTSASEVFWEEGKGVYRLQVAPFTESRMDAKN